MCMPNAFGRKIIRSWNFLKAASIYTLKHPILLLPPVGASSTAKLALSQQGEGCSYIMINRARAEQSLTRGWVKMANRAP